MSSDRTGSPADRAAPDTMPMLERRRSDIEHAFDRTYNSASIAEIEFDPQWSHSQGVYIGATRAAVNGPVGTVVKTRAPLPDNRRLLLVKTRFGNVVIFDHYSPGKGPARYFDHHLPPQVGAFFVYAGEFGVKEFEQIVSSRSPGNNIGARLESLFVDNEAFTALQNLPKDDSVSATLKTLIPDTYK